GLGQACGAAGRRPLGPPAVWLTACAGNGIPCCPGPDKKVKKYWNLLDPVALRVSVPTGGQRNAGNVLLSAPSQYMPASFGIVYGSDLSRSFSSNGRRLPRQGSGCQRRKRRNSPAACRENRRRGRGRHRPQLTFSARLGSTTPQTAPAPVRAP